MIISIASGKGGTGKTLVATSLALSLKDKQKVQLLDCDVEEPNDHIFIKPIISSTESVIIPFPRVNENKCSYCGKCARICAYHAIAVFSKTTLVFPNLCHGCGACSFLCPEGAISEVVREIGVVECGYSDGINFVQGRLNIGEPMPTPVIRKVKEKANHDYTVIIDVSPGTSCPVVQTIKGSDFCLLVTEPTPFGLNDLVLAVETIKELGIPSGVVINRADTGDSKIEEYCRKEKIPIMLTIPLDLEIARFYSQGIPLVKEIPKYRRSFEELFNRILETLNERNNRFKR